MTPTEKTEWINVLDELPIQGFAVHVKNGKRIVHAKYYRKKWWWWDRELHKVTHWRKDPINYPKISPKDLRAFNRRAEKYKHQMQTKNFNIPALELVLKMV